MTETVDYSEYGLIRLPCPKCGGEALLNPTGPDSVVVVCADCDNRGPEERRRFADEDLARVSARATAAWNRQAETTEWPISGSIHPTLTASDRHLLLQLLTRERDRVIEQDIDGQPVNQRRLEHVDDLIVRLFGGVSPTAEQWEQIRNR